MVHGYMSYVDRVPTFSIGAVETGTDFADLGLLDSLATVKAVFVVGTLVFVGGDFQSANEERAELVAVFDTTNGALVAVAQRGWGVAGLRNNACEVLNDLAWLFGFR